MFEQKFTLPSGVTPEKVTSTINADGVLTITAPKGNPAATSNSNSTIESKMDKVLSPSSWLGSGLRDSSLDDNSADVKVENGIE